MAHWCDFSLTHFNWIEFILVQVIFWYIREIIFQKWHEKSHRALHNDVKAIARVLAHDSHINPHGRKVLYDIFKEEELG